MSAMNQSNYHMYYLPQKLAYLGILLTGILLIACNQQQKEKKAKQAENLEVTKTAPGQQKKSDVIEKVYIPKEKLTTQFDTSFPDQDLKISLKNSYLDSHVSNEFEKDGELYIGKYRNSEKKLLISLSGKVLVDTTFRKNDFAKFVESDFLNVAVFKEYRFENFQNDTITLHGMLVHPKSDWKFVIQHYFDLKTRNFSIEEKIEPKL